MSPKTKHGTVQVICPSYGRTGTTSMQAALEILGFGPCYHMNNVFKNVKAHATLWEEAYDGRVENLDTILEGFKSVADWPTCDFYKEIMTANPNAKVVATLREPDSWWKSMASSISYKNEDRQGWGLFFMQVLSSDVCTMYRFFLRIKPVAMGEEEAKADYLRHNAEIVARVPREKLLEFSVKQGWGPLCEFLDVPVPDVPFPHAKSTDDLKAKIKRSNRIGWVFMMAALGLAGASVATAMFFGGQKAGGTLAAVEAAVLAHRVRKAARNTVVVR